MMKISKLLSLLTLFVLVSCASVQVSSDYDTEKDFNNYKTFAFYKTGIDKVEISDLDKKRILRSIDQVMQEKGFTKSSTPDVLVNIFTKTEKQVNVNNNNWGWGYGWGPWYGGPTSVSTSTNGVLYIDLINAADKQLIWQGRGEGYLTHNLKKKDERILEFVSSILSQYPPGSDK